ncbi:hypothetical protein GS504_01190 [Rhodococcus hoagii]|nr:hypothetical protein [Prescottella equi]NKS71712.1 hypothetical protein [Prescottella equi]
MLAVLIALGLVVDGGGKLQAKQRADTVANEAARRAGQAIVLPLGVRGEGTVVEPMAALVAANKYLASAGPDIRGTAVVTSPTTLVVTVETDYEPRILSAIGMGTMTGHGTATVHLNHTNTGAGGGTSPDIPPLGR